MSNKESDGRQEKREFRPLPMDEETKRRLWAAVKEKNPTPDHVLETQLRDPRIPKDEIVHYAARRIAELEAQLADAQTSVHALETDLHLSNSQLKEAQADAERLMKDKDQCGDLVNIADAEIVGLVQKIEAMKEYMQSRHHPISGNHWDNFLRLNPEYSPHE